MKAHYVEAINWLYPRTEQSIFLGGGITGCEDWQREAFKALEDLNLTIYNPRRQSFDTSNPKESENQIEWEFIYLRVVNQVLFYFPSETLCPITLFELGAAIERNSGHFPEQKLFIGCHPEYKRLFDVKYQCKMFHRVSPQSAPKVHVGLESLLREVVEYNKFLDKRTKLE
jgi:hypothetical protein